MVNPDFCAKNLIASFPMNVAHYICYVFQPGTVVSGYGDHNDLEPMTPPKIGMY